MRKLILRFGLALLCITGLTASGVSQQKLAQTGMKFLNVLPDARSAAMAGAVTSIEQYASTSLFYNPAGIARIQTFMDASVGQTQWIADINLYFGSLAFNLHDYGVVGLFFQSVDYGEINETIIDARNPLGYQDLGTFKPTALVGGLGYARALTDKFSIGGVVKYATQNLGSHVIEFDTTTNAMTRAGNKAGVLAFDFGILYHTGYKSLNFGMDVRNFSREIAFISEDFQLPLTFKIGLSMNVLDMFEMDPNVHSFTVSIDAQHPRDFQEQVSVGGEYMFMDILSLRAGYVSPADEQGFSFGAGVKKSFGDYGLGVDYAYSPFGLFGHVQRFSLQFSL